MEKQLHFVGSDYDRAKVSSKNYFSSIYDNLSQYQKIMKEVLETEIRDKEISRSLIELLDKTEEIKKQISVLQNGASEQMVNISNDLEEIDDYKYPGSILNIF